MKVLVALIALLFLPALSFGNVIEKDLITSNGRTRAYYLYVPKSVKPGNPVPLVLTLHGSGHNGLSLVEKWTDIADKEGFIVAGPDSTNPSGWETPTDGPDFLRDLVEGLKAKYPIDPRRVYLFGHSAGACFALQIGLMESQYFAGVAIHAGALQEGNSWLINAAARKIPMAIWVGTVDNYFPLATVRATRDQLKAHDIPVELTEIPKHDHWYYDMAPKINKDAWEFLKKNSLPVDPQYRQYQFEDRGRR